MIAKALGGLFAATTLDPVHPRDPAIAKMLGVGMTTSSGVRVDEDKALGYPPFWRGVNLICNGLKKTDIYIYRRVGADNRELAENHPSFKLLYESPDAGRWMGAGTFRQTMTHNALVWGNGCAHIDREGGTDAKRIMILPPDRTSMAYGNFSEAGRFEFNSEGTKYYYVRQPSGGVVYFPGDEVLHIKGLSPDGGWGYSVVDKLKESLGVGVAARDFGARFFGQGGVGAGLLFMPPGMDPEQQTEFVRAIKENHQGLGNAHKFLVLDSETKYEQMTIPQEHAQFLETRQFEIREVANILGVQPHKLGDATRTSYASLEQANQEHLDDTLDPWFTAWEEECELKLLSESDRQTHYCEFNRESLMRMDHAAKTSSFTAGRNGGWFSVNDIRKMMNLPPIPNGDVYLSPLNMAPSDGNVIETEPDDDEEDARQQPPPRDDNPVAELAGHIVRKLCNRVAKDAKHAAQAGGAKYLAFIESIAELGDGPQSIRGVLTTATTYLKAELNAYAEPPYSASSLANNVTANADRIADEAFNASLAALGK
jgi:HK97 family phage portal protein